MSRDQGNLLKLFACFLMLVDHIVKIFFFDSFAVVLLPFTFWAYLIFAFQIGESYKHTRNYGKFFIRLLCLALISEIPYSLVFPGRANVVFTLLLGYSVILLFYGFRFQFSKKGVSYIFSVFVPRVFIIFPVILFLSFFVSGGPLCVLLIPLLYYFYRVRFPFRWLPGVYLSKWFFYIFYPGHLLILAALKFF